MAGWIKEQHTARELEKDGMSMCCGTYPLIWREAMGREERAALQRAMGLLVKSGDARACGVSTDLGNLINGRKYGGT